MKRNFIAATRGGKNCFAGVIDHVRIYSVIHKEFEKDGIVPEMSSRRVDESFLTRFKQFKAINAERLKAWQNSAVARQAPSVDRLRLSTWSKQVAEIRKEREGLGEEKIAELVGAANYFKQKYEALRTELGKEFDARPDVAQKLAKGKDLSERIGAIRKELDENNTKMPAKRKLMDEAHRALRTIEDEARHSVQDQVGEIDEKVRELGNQYNELVAAAKAKAKRKNAATTIRVCTP